MERRSAIKGLGGLLLLPSLAFSKYKTTLKPALRIAHLTDVHLKGELGAPEKFAKCLHHVQQQKVDLILNGGDIVFDMNKENLGKINQQWSLLEQITKSECSLPVHYCLGNHDIWWSEDKNQTFYGKKYTLDRLKLEKPYYRMVKGGWKLIILDSVHLDIDDTWYISKLGEEQFYLLTALLMIEDNVVNRWEMLGGDMHTDTAKIINLFHKYPNVKLCVSGHLHMRDKVIYNDVTYLCNGAVSGAWWKGNRRETAPGYGLIDLYADGTFDEKYINY